MPASGGSNLPTCNLTHYFVVYKTMCIFVRSINGTCFYAYTPEQEDEFRDVFYTMQDTDVAGWVRSLQLRGIALPENIKDEVFLIIGERRLTPHS